jgi:ATP-dependent Zn protease
MDTMHEATKFLLEKETITGEEFMNFFNRNNGNEKK